MSDRQALGGLLSLKIVKQRLALSRAAFSANHYTYPGSMWGSLLLQLWVLTTKRFVEAVRIDETNNKWINFLCVSCFFSKFNESNYRGHVHRCCRWCDRCLSLALAWPAAGPAWHSRIFFFFFAIFPPCFLSESSCMYPDGIIQFHHGLCLIFDLIIIIIIIINANSTIHNWQSAPLLSTNYRRWPYLVNEWCLPVDYVMQIYCDSD